MKPFLALVLLVAAHLGSLAHASAPIPIERFFANPAISHVRIAPGGRRVAFLAPLAGRMGIASMDLATGKVEPLVSTTDESIQGFVWKSDDCIVFRADVGGNESLAVQAINLRTRRIVRLLESIGQNNYTRQDGYWGNVEDYWITNPQKIIVSGSREPNSWRRGLYAADVTTAKRSIIDGSAGDRNSLGQVFDNAGRVRIRYQDTFAAVEVRASRGEDAGFTTMLKRPRDALLLRLEQAEILADNRTLLFVDYSQHDRGAVVAWDLLHGKEREVLFVPPEGEVTELILGRSRERLLGVRYDGDRLHTVWLDRELQAIQAALDRTLPGTINRITGWSDDRKKFIVFVFSDRESGVHFIFDLSRPTPQLMPLGSARPDLETKALAEMKPVRFLARDGLQLQGYLSRPPGRTGAGPLILHPHGGPYGVRDSWGYDPEVQFLASRGYTVLQVNFRGSGGFGRKFLEAGRFEWGRKMQDDLTDAVQWAIAEGIADPKRVAIYGASYGGYAALAGVINTPDLYRCAVNYVGVADLLYLGRRDQNLDPAYNEFYLEKWVHADIEELKRRSPANQVERIKVPVLHAYGGNDPRVELRQWKRLRAELDRHRIPYESCNQEDEGHGFHNVGAALDFHSRLEDFLKRHLLSAP